MAPPFQRRRYPFRSFMRGASVSGFVFLALVFLALLTFLAPHFLENSSSSFQSHSHSGRTPAMFGMKFERSNAVGSPSFVLPDGGGISGRDLWRSKHSKYYYGCSNSSKNFPSAKAITTSNRYLLIAASGGLNQQRTGIVDGVVAARILNATLVIPKLDQKSFWKDASDFSEIFDVDWFISSLSKDVKIIKKLPARGKYFASPYRMRVPRKCTPKCYQKTVLPALLKKHVVQLSKFDYRLANKLDNDLQKLRCRVNYHALKFTDPILEMGNLLIQRMRAKSNHFIALHLRFEPDMLAFSGCYYGGGEKEIKELEAIRRRWKNLHGANPEKARRQGKCPLKPEEVALMLRALGFGSDVHMYVASGEVYGREASLAPLKSLFPNFHSKETIASKEELAPFSSFSSRMAALDFIVCDGSDVFVTNNNGNMAKILAGRRRYFGHMKTIRPNAKKLYSLFLNRGNMTWKEFATNLRRRQRGFMGEPKELRPGRGEFHENPSTCICETPVSKPTMHTVPLSWVRDHEVDDTGKNYNETIDNQSVDEEPEWPDTDGAEVETLEREPASTTESDYNLFIRSDEPELEEILSD